MPGCRNWLVTRYSIAQYVIFVVVLIESLDLGCGSRLKSAESDPWDSTSDSYCLMRCFATSHRSNNASMELT